LRKDIIVETATHETRIAMLEDNHLVELLVERPEHERVVGNICKGVVTAVIPSIQAAFVDIGMDKAAFLQASDVTGGADWIDFDDEENQGSGPGKGKEREYRIQEMVKEGQEVVVQITKESIGTKGPRVTSQISLPGRFLVLVPHADYVGVSRRIEDWGEKRRLRDLARKLKSGDFGVIVRTAAFGKSDSELKNDLKQLSRIWQNVEKQVGNTSAPAMIHKDVEMTSGMIRDLFTPDIDSVIIDSKPVYKEILSYLKGVAPQLRSRVHMYDGTAPIFDAYGIENEIGKALHRKVWLKNGGYILIEPTEALVTIDVNSGRYAGSKGHEETVFQTNLEACAEVARQLRLRDIGGIIVIDLIDMEDRNNRRQVHQELVKAMSHDRARTRMSREITEFGLIEMTRQRIRPSLLFTFSESCPVCDGTGRIMSGITMVTQIGRWLRRAQAGLRERKLKLKVHPTVALSLNENGQEKLVNLQDEFKIELEIEEDLFVHVEEFRVFSGERNIDVTDEFKQ